MRRLAFCATILLTCLLLSPAAPAQNRGQKAPPGMKRVEGKYHVLIYDLSDEDAREVLSRMEAMVEEYSARTREFSGRLNRKLPFMIFKRHEDYVASGAPAASAGLFDGETLKAVAGEKLTAETWNIIQHEGFHQFAYAVIGGDLPMWVNEGLAEYFGSAIYTGSGFVSGGVPADRIERIQKSMEGRRFKPVQRMMEFTNAEWNQEMRIENYDQAFAMVQFLAHGEDGKYQKAFGRFMILLNKGTPWSRAWLDTFGSAQGFEDRWAAWWKTLDETSFVGVEAEATTGIFANYLARATSQKQTFADLPALTAAMKDNTVRSNKNDLLPASLATDGVLRLAHLRKLGATAEIKTLPLGPAGRVTQPAIQITTKTGDTYVGTYKLRGDRVTSVDVKKTPAEKAAEKK